MHTDILIRSLQARGHRMTIMRRFILSSFDKADAPLAASKLLDNLSKHGLDANKTTVYRELKFLLEQNIIKPVHFGDGIGRYELTGAEHHHHFVCTKCNRSEDVELTHDVDEEGKRLGKKRGFKITGHSLEFFGICKSCQRSR